jgi:hypothetical protein
MPVGSEKILAELVDRITGKQDLYRTAYASDLKRIECDHGAEVLAEVLSRVERNREAGPENQGDHAREVAREVDRVLRRWQPQDRRFK